MKLYKQEPVVVIRVLITKSGFASEYLTLSECSSLEAQEYIKRVIKDKANLFPDKKDKRTTVQTREATGAKNGKCTSFHFYGIDPKTVSQLIIKSLENEPNTI